MVVQGDKRVKDNIKSAVISKLSVLGVFGEEKVQSPPLLPNVLSQQPGLTFEQQKELMRMQLEHERAKHKLEVKKQLELERIRQQSEKAKLDLEGCRLSMIKEGVLSADGGGQAGSSGKRPLDISNLQWVPPFNERDPDSFFVLFECVADALV